MYFCKNMHFYGNERKIIYCHKDTMWESEEWRVKSEVMEGGALS